MSAAQPSGQEDGLPGVRLVIQRSRWLLLGVTIGLAVGFGAGRAQKPTFESTAIITVSSPQTVDPISLARGAQALARLATSPAVVSASLRDVGLADAADDPRRYVRVEAAPDAPIITVSAAADEPTTAQRITGTVSHALVFLGPFPPFTATVVAQPTLPTRASTPSWALPASGAGLGVLLTLTLAATVPGRREVGAEQAGEREQLPA